MSEAPVAEIAVDAEALRGEVKNKYREVAVDPGGEVTQLNYRLRPVSAKWKIIDVYLNGTVSELALRRSEYSSLIQREGLDSLLVALNQKIANLSGSTPADQSP